MHVCTTDLDMRIHLKKFYLKSIGKVFLFYLLNFFSSFTSEYNVIIRMTKKTEIMVNSERKHSRRKLQIEDLNIKLVKFKYLGNALTEY